LSDDLKAKLEEFDVNVSEIVRSCLIEEVRRRENLSRLDEINGRLKVRGKIQSGTASELIREDRDTER